MSEADRDKWDEHYRGRPCASLSQPNPLLVEWLPRLEIDSPSPLAADVACGLANVRARVPGMLAARIDAEGLLNVR